MPGDWTDLKTETPTVGRRFEAMLDCVERTVVTAVRPDHVEQSDAKPDFRDLCGNPVSILKWRYL